MDLSCVAILFPVINFWFSTHKLRLIEYYVKHYSNIKYVFYTSPKTKKWLQYKNSFLVNMSYYIDSHPKMPCCPFLGTTLINFLTKIYYRKAYITGMNFYDTRYRSNYYLQPLDDNVHCIANDKIFIANIVCPSSNIEFDYAHLCQWFNKSLLVPSEYSDRRYNKTACFAKTPME